MSVSPSRAGELAENERERATTTPGCATRSASDTSSRSTSLSCTAKSTLGAAARTKTCHRENGYLWFDGYRLEEYAPGLFFSSTGEALDFRGETPTWRNIRLARD